MAYGDDAGFSAWLTAYGFSLPSGAATEAVLRARGSAYIDSTYEPVWTGNRTDGVSQTDAWPRTGALFNCVTAIADDVTPVAVVNASYRAAWLEASTSGVLASSFSSGQRVKSQQVDTIRREFFDDGGVAAGSGAGGFIDAEIDGMMRQFICTKTGGFMFTSIGGSCA